MTRDRTRDRTHYAGNGCDPPHGDPAVPDDVTDPDADVHVRLTSLQNVRYRHDVSTGLSRREWLELERADVDDVIRDAVLRNVDAFVLDEPTPAERAHWPDEEGDHDDE